MTPAREAIVLPLLFLTVALIAGVQIDDRVAFVSPSLYSLVLATLVLAALVRSGALAPARLLHGARPMVANANGAVVLGALFAASSQLLAMLTPRSGLPMFFVGAFLLVLLVNTLVVLPDRVHLLRSLAVTLGSTLLLKFVILAALSAPAQSRTARVLAAIFDAATFGTIAQAPQPATAGYLAFLALGLYLIGLALLPRQRSDRAHGVDLVPR